MSIDKKEKILAAAQDIFLTDGFEGASIGKIAKQASVAKSLVFHHFEDKATLFKAVKAFTIQTIDAPPGFEIDKIKTLDTFIDTVIEHRYLLYQNNVKLRRLMEWQKLEDTDQSLSGGTQYSPTTWAKPIQTLQKAGEIDDKLDVPHIILFIRGVVHAAFMDDPFDRTQNILDQRKVYIKQAKLMLKKSLRPLKP